MWTPNGEQQSDNPLDPNHYKRFVIQPLDFIEKNNLSFVEGNIVKYVLRAPYKGNQLEDLQKARVYLDRLISMAEAGQNAKSTL